MYKILIIVISLLFLTCGNQGTGSDESDYCLGNFTTLCDCMGEIVPDDCTDNTILGCAVVDDCGDCVYGNSGNIEFFTCDCNGDLISDDCTDITTIGCAVENACDDCWGGATDIINEPVCSCPENFSVSPQSTLTQDDCVPDHFIFTTSTLQAGYFIIYIVSDSIILETTNCENVNDCDWIGAFNPITYECVGSTMWDLNSCNNQVCSINVMGASGESTTGYMSPGDIPIFQLYDASEDKYYNVIPSENYPWYPGQVYPADGPDIIFTIGEEIL